MSFQAPDTDADASAGFTAPDDDQDPPRSVGGFLENVLTNAAHDINPVNIVKGLGQSVKTGAYDLPKAALESSVDLTKGTAKALTTGELPSMEDVAKSPLLEKTREMTEPIAKDPVGYAYKNPVDAALLVGSAAAPFLGAEGAAAEGEALKNVPRGTPPPVPPEELPIVPAGAKTGDPHGLFAYTEKEPIRPGMQPENKYQVFGDPSHDYFKNNAWGTQKTAEELKQAGIPITGRVPPRPSAADMRAKFASMPTEKTPPVVPMGGKGPTPEPASRMPPDPNAPPVPKPPEPPEDPLKDIKDWMKSKGQTIAAKPGIAQRLAQLADEESAKLGGKDLGLQIGQIKGMGPGFKGLEKGKALVNYAREQGYFDPTMTDTARKALVEQNMNKAGAQLGGLRDLASQRGAFPIEEARNALKTQLTEKYGIDAPKEIETVLAKFDKQAKTDPSFSGMADLATELHKGEQTASKMGLHPGPTTDGANEIARIGNDSARKLLNPEESDMFTKSLRDFGAHKKLEQALSAGGRKALVGRGAPGSATNRFIQEFLDRGGYRLGGNIANKVAKSVMGNQKIQTLPQFFEELAHQSNDAVDDAIQGLYQGGRVPADVRKYVGC